MKRTTRGKPLVSLAVVLPLLVAGGIAVPALLVGGYASHHGTTAGAVGNAIAPGLAIPGLLLWIPACLLIANRILHAIPPLRRIAEDDAMDNGRPDFERSQRQLLRMFLTVAAICVPIIAAIFALGR
jgi:hypothetical protein